MTNADCGFVPGMVIAGSGRVGSFARNISDMILQRFPLSGRRGIAQLADEGRFRVGRTAAELSQRIHNP